MYCLLEKDGRRHSKKWGVGLYKRETDGTEYVLYEEDGEMYIKLNLQVRFR